VPSLETSARRQARWKCQPTASTRKARELGLVAATARACVRRADGAAASASRTGHGVRHLDLFAGIGGFALAARRVGWETVGFCETNEFCRRVIERRFDRVRWVSLSGHHDGGSQRLGLEGDQELTGLDPDWLVIENASLRWQTWVPELRRRLWARGYASLPIRVRASRLGAPHDRPRIYLVAHADRDSEPLRAVHAEVARLCAPSGFWRDQPDPMGVDDGLPARVDRLHALGNAIVPQCAELVFRAIRAVISGQHF
jgi:DNA (cytosine-5)-methyltransferase 1